MVQNQKFRDEFSSRLVKALRLSGHADRGSGAFLCKVADVSSKAASKWLNAESVPRHDKLVLISKALGVRSEWLQYGIEPMKENDIESNVELAVQPIRQFRYPVVSWVSAGNWAEAVELYERAETVEWTDYATALNRAFWLRVEGDSMTSPHGQSIPEGMLVLVDTMVPPRSGSLVVAKLRDSDEATFKKLVIDAGTYYLKPLNPSYKTIELPPDGEIVGVVVEAKMRFTL